MTALAIQPSSKRRLLLASDRSDQSSELVSILQSVGEVDAISTSDIPEAPADHFAGIVVDINLRSSESVQHGERGPTDTISRPFDAKGILQRIRSALPCCTVFDDTPSAKVLPHVFA